MRKDKGYLEDIVNKAMLLYSLTVNQTEFLIEETNIFYKLDTNEGQFVLKIFQEESSKLEDNLIEAHMLEYVSSHSTIMVPKMLASRQNKYIEFVEDQKGINRRVAIYLYLEGEDIDSNETDETFFDIGVLMADLHNCTKNIILPKELNPKRWDKVFYYRDEYAIYNEEKYDKYFTKEDRMLLDKVIPYVNMKLAHFYDRESFLIHGDMNPWNIKLHKGTLRLFDFEEGMEGNEIHDLAIMLFYYRYDKNFNYEKVKKNVIAGYESIRNLPKFSDFDIDLLIIARTLNFINYVLIIHEDPTNYIKVRMDRVREFLLHYSIIID